MRASSLATSVIAAEAAMTTAKAAVSPAEPTVSTAAKAVAAAAEPTVSAHPSRGGRRAPTAVAVQRTA